MGLGNLQAQSGNAEQAFMLCTYILNHPSSEEETISRVEQLRTDLEKESSLQQVMAVQKKAFEKTFDMIVNDALESTYCSA